MTVRMATSCKSVEAIQAVDQPLFHQKIKRAIDRGRLCGGVILLQLIEQIIGFDGAMALPNQRQNMTALRRQPLPPLTAKFFRRLQRVMLALLVVMASRHFNPAQWSWFVMDSCNVII